MSCVLRLLFVDLGSLLAVLVFVVVCCVLFAGVVCSLFVWCCLLRCCLFFVLKRYMFVCVCVVVCCLWFSGLTQCVGCLLLLASV